MQEIRFIFIFLVIFSFYYQSEGLRRIKRGSSANQTAHHGPIVDIHADDSGEFKLKVPDLKQAAVDHSWAMKAVAAVEHAIGKAMSSVNHHHQQDNKSKKSALHMQPQLHYVNTADQPVVNPAPEVLGTAEFLPASAPQSQQTKLTAEKEHAGLPTAAQLVRDKRGLNGRFFGDLQREDDQNNRFPDGAAEVLIIDNGLPAMMSPEHGYNGVFQYRTPTLRSIASDFKKLAQSKRNEVESKRSDNAASRNENGSAGVHNNAVEYKSNKEATPTTTTEKQQNDKDSNFLPTGNATSEATVDKLPPPKADEDGNKSPDTNNATRVDNENGANDLKLSATNAAQICTTNRENNKFYALNGVKEHAALKHIPMSHHQKLQEEHDSHDKVLKKSLSALLTAQRKPKWYHSQELNKRHEDKIINDNSQKNGGIQQQENQNHGNSDIYGQCSGQPQHSPKLQAGQFSGKGMPSSQSMLKFFKMMMYKMGADSPMHGQGAQVTINTNPSSSVMTVGPISEGGDDWDSMDYFYNPMEPKAAILRAQLPAAVPIPHPFAMMPPYNIGEIPPPINDLIDSALEMLMGAEGDDGDEEMEIRCPVHHEPKKKATETNDIAETAADQNGKKVVQVCTCRLLRKKKNNS